MVEAAKADEAGLFDFGGFTPVTQLGEVSWLRPLQRLHCSAYNYVKTAKIGNVRSSYYRALVLTTRTEVCVKDCMPPSGPDDVEADGFAPR